ncbi:pyruvate dehydrogenase (acetyl-transferring), homodimeric type [Pokkaliibacter sp. MBI-7]|uniref:Pyruvate dehydrogenase E1 component n=1 Tax=Proteobacteria bacterium 228 TaxID=2083153 RepID=A0A2S5KTB4_9PROT|nr:MULTISPECIES: pyruvate dehydrogenase (acetyl-transferring), homodimeric type [Pokkaliibacter]MDH2431583.1 pyruvate dehydrogenase (acetyl-transferring), homodimeric type [Pokkaliibacter sp. MBI-7]PPC77988.1 pyruvate dehydrogenase (acetyl-transferring), homodimeric type [Pokkaliibacter plantistimulans]
MQDFIEDKDPIETREWLEALESVAKNEGGERATYLLRRLGSHAREMGVDGFGSLNTPYINTIKPKDEARMPGDLFMERRIRSLIRWNALAMVMRANDNDEGLGGHISSFSSSATLYDVGFNYFFRGPEGEQEADMVFFQGHISPGIYARAYLEGRLTEEQLDNFRREVDGNGLSSYPHPWLMPDFWQFPTVSMGLGPIQAIYQAHIMRYLSARDMVKRGDRKVWCFLGDGECDEPESLGAISLAGREKLENLIFVINCNLQRLDGPVRGNGKIVQELEGIFRGAGWNVIKVLWGRHWDPLLERDEQGLLQKRMDEVVDGELQNYKANGGAYTREHFFGKYPDLKDLVKDLSDQDIMNLNRGGHDPYKVYAAYHAAVNHKGQPTVILAQTVKGYGTGQSGEAKNDTHSLKKVKVDDLKAFRDRFNIPLSDDQLESVPYYRPAPDSAELKYMFERRKSLGGMYPARRKDFTALETPQLDFLGSQLKGTGDREISSTMAFVRILSTLVKDKNIGARIVPIVPDEARTFGMEGMFRQLGIYSSAGQRYVPHDRDQIMFYKESKDGQILEEGINEPGAMSAWIACATAYSNSNCPLIPFYVYYSMFGFQRIGDLAWAAGDMQARGFLIGATSGRTTLNGEGLQHQDGHSHLVASTIPNCVTYDPTYSYELAVIIQDGIRRMYHEKENKFYYITTMNEAYQHPDMPAGAEEGIIKGMYLLEEANPSSKLSVQLMGSGTILNEVREAAKLLRENFNVDANIWSATSMNELRRDALDCSRWNLLHPESEPRVPYVTECLNKFNGPVIASTDYMKLYSDQLREFVPHRFKVLGTDGFGRSDTRKKLRHFFEVDRYFVAIAALKALAEEGSIDVSEVSRAIKLFGINPDKLNPVTV